MNTQPSLFDAAAAAEARNEALARVEANANSAWKSHCEDAIRWLSETRPDFTTDDVWELMHQRLNPMPHEPRAIGAMMTNAAKRGLITPTDRYTPSARPECHRRPVKIWKSLKTG
jgi:hypothetical protein